MSGTVIYLKLLSDHFFSFSFTNYKLQLQSQFTIFLKLTHQNIKEPCKIIEYASKKFDMQFEDMLY